MPESGAAGSSEFRVFETEEFRRSMTGGRGSYEREFSHYEPAPHDIQNKIIEEAKKEKEEE